MQTTLLGLAIAFIIALLAALIGPFFVDWNQFRPQFEAEASRILGTPVQVGGALDARLLPVPSLSLRDVQVGGAYELGRVRAAKLDVAFSLGSLMRGEVRADELTINGASLDLGLDAGGRIDWPISAGGYDLGSLAIDRVNLTGRIALHDAASRSTVELDDIAFSGDVRALAGSMRGDGNFRLSGTRYPFRVSSTPGVGNVGNRVHLTIDPAETALAIDLDGLLTFQNRSPRFDGALLLARPAPPKTATGPVPPPWKVAAKIKADSGLATLEQIDASYGADETSLKFAGTAGFRFGADPQLQATLTSKTIDADRLRGTDAAPELLLSGLRETLASLPELPFLTRVSLAADQVMLGGKPVQNVVADVHHEAAGWRIDRLDARAPGATLVTLAGATAQPSAGAGFSGAMTLNSAEPDVFAAWLRGRGDAGLRAQKPLRLRGNLTVAPDRVVLDAMSGEIDGSAVDGRLAMLHPDNAPSRADIRIKADRLDLDSVVTLARSLAGPDATWPAEAQLSLEIGRALSAGQEMRPFGLDLRYGAQTIALDRLRVGEASGLMLDGTGAFDRASAAGKLSVSAASASMAQIASLATPLAPSFAARLAAVPTAPGAVRMKLALDIARNATQTDRANLTTTLTLDGPQLIGSASVTATPPLDAIASFNVDALRDGEVAVTMKLASPQGRNLFALLGLESVLGTENAAAQLDATLNGTLKAPLRIAAKFAGAVEADVQGSAEPFADVRKATLDLTVRRASFAPVLALKSGDPRGQVSNLKSRLTLAGDRIAFDGLDGTIAGARLRGKVALTLAEPRTIDGEFGLDTLELAPLFNLAIGSGTANPAEPLGAGLVQGWRGRLAFQALRGGLPGRLELRPVSGTVKSDGRSLTFDAIKGGIGGGDMSADIDARPSLSGLAVNARIALAGVDGAALRYRTLAMPGRTTLKMTLSSQGRSAEALAGALSGDGLLTLDNLKIAGLDPRAFDLMLRASDDGRITDDARLAQVMQTALNAGPLSVPSAQIGIGIKDGNLRIGATTLEGEGARAIVSGGYDVGADQADIRAILTSTTAGSGTSRPEVRLFAAGPPDGLTKSLDVASLSTWLAVRTIDRETRRLDQLERETMPGSTPAAIPPAAQIPADRSAPAQMPGVTAIPTPVPARPRISPPKPTPPPVPTANPNAQVAPLPPAIDVRPAPGSNTFRPPRPRPPMVLTPAPLPRPAF